jgi:hypothetical protein
MSALASSALTTLLVDKKRVKLDLSRFPFLDLVDEKECQVRAFVVRVGEGNPFDKGEDLWFPGPSVFFLLCDRRTPILLDQSHYGRRPQGIGSEVLLENHYVFRNEDGSFSVTGQGEWSQISASEAERLYRWLPYATGNETARLGARSRPSALASL